ncbi:VOC family protein [Nonomuraea sp. NPDC050790]|uniref:VOC family protein n=1 Tax=Nonomuraea sp. NPDC050790 TaxID=3364371 RepID=UPI0037885202
MATALQTGHVGLNVTDLDRSIDFYSQVFGLTLYGRTDGDDWSYARLGRPDELVLTLWQQQISGRYDAGRPGLHHLSFEAPGIDELEAIETKLGELGISIRHGGIVPHRAGGESGGLFFEDPDGTRLEIYVSAGVTAPAPHEDAPTCGFF